MKREGTTEQRTMSEKPGKRLVSRREYFTLMGQKGLVYCLATFFVLVGLYFAGVALCDLSFHDATNIMILLPMIGLSSLSLLVGLNFFKRVREIKPLAPITRHNTGDLPAIETLVRASDLPPSGQQAELLRSAMPQSQETAPEELLRATTKIVGADNFSTEELAAPNCNKLQRFDRM